MKSCITISLVEEARGGPFVLWDGLENSINFAAELGYDAVEIFAPGPEAIDADSLGKLLDKAGLKLAALGTGAGWVKHRLQLADANAENRAAAEFCKKHHRSRWSVWCIGNHWIHAGTQRSYRRCRRSQKNIWRRH